MRVLCLLLVWVNLQYLCADELKPVELANRDNMPGRFVNFENEYGERVFYNAKLEPREGIIHGAGQAFGDYLDYSQLMPEGSKPLMYMTYVPLTRDLQEIVAWYKNTQRELHILNKTQPTVLQIGLNLTAGKDDGTGQVNNLVSGRFDQQLNHFVSALNSLATPTYLRIGYEFEGEWNNYSPEGYVAAYRKIYSAIQEAGIKNIATVWCAAGGSAGFIDKRALMDYYPGDEYVDWWGVDIFSPEEIPHVWLEQFYQLAGRHKKPVMIGEATPRYVGANKGWHSWYRWYKPFFEMVRKYPQIKAISYINWDWAYWSDEIGFSWHDWEDARLQNDELVTQLYINEISQPLWIGSEGLSSILPGE